MDNNSHCKDSKLNVTSSKENMEQNGWIFDITRHKQDKYIVHLNQQKLSFASGGQTRKEVKFSFIKGDTLRLQEDGAIIKIYSLEIKC